MRFKCRLKQAMRTRAISLLYQPIVNVRDGTIQKAEALLRWDTESLNPHQIITKARECGLGDDLTEYIVGQAFRDALRFRTLSPDFSVAVNLSYEEILSTETLRVISEFSSLFIGTFLVFEITEQHQGSPEDFKDFIDAVRTLGHQVYIDDFGVAGSNFELLFGVNLDGIKLDRLFVQSAAAMQTIGRLAEIAHRLNLACVVEGVETEVQLSVVKDCCGAIYAQGYLLGKPRNPAILSVLLRNPDTLNASPREFGRPDQIGGAIRRDVAINTPIKEEDTGTSAQGKRFDEFTLLD